MRRVLFIGPTGVGKSTLINVLINNDATKAAMASPAKADDTAGGQTAFFTTYYDFPDNAYTDSIGLGDHRFEAKNIMKSLKLVLKNASIGYNKIYICLEYGRISSDTRRYIDLITTVFGNNVLKWSSIIFTRCNDQSMTKEKYLNKNSQDTDIVTIIKQINTIVFGDNMTDEDPEMERFLYKRRQDFLRRIRQDLDDTAKQEYFQLSKQNVIARAEKMVKIMFGSIPKITALVSDIKTFAQAIASAMQSSKYRNYFGECSICLGDITDENKPVMTQCSHVFHETCLMKWFGKKVDRNCPICRLNFGQQPKFYISLTADT
jgi:GTPase SAR1 family protein